MGNAKTFGRGGIHPNDRKEYTASKAIEYFPAPEIVHIPVNQHIGAPAKAVVNAGDRVLKNQIVAKGDAFVTSIVHSPVSGEVAEIKTVKFPGDRKGEVIVVKNDGKNEKVQGTEEEREPTKDYKEFLNVIKEAGIIGMGGAGFPSYIKLCPPDDKKCNVLIINAAECEPYLTADHRAMLEFSDKLLKGTSYLLDITGINECYIGIESNKPDAIKKLKEANTDKRIKVSPLKTRYPQGAEKQLIYALTKRTVPIRKLPFEVGVIVQNVGTVMAIWDAVKFNKPLTERILTVSGKGINNPKNIVAAVGTKVQDVIEFCGGLKESTRYAINGGPMMGKAFDDLELPVTKTTSGLLFLTEDECEEAEASACIRCSKCLSVCPMGLNPTMLMDASKKRKYEMMDDVLDCIECGSCTFICPVNRQLAAEIIKGKEKYTKFLKRSSK